MSVTFFALDADNGINNTITDYELNVSNVNGAHIQIVLGLEYDSRDQPAGEATLDEFLRLLARGYRHARSDHMRAYLNRLNDLWGAAVDAGAAKICWA